MQGTVCAFELKINKCSYKLKKFRYSIVSFSCLVKRGYFFETPGMFLIHCVSYILSSASFAFTQGSTKRSSVVAALLGR